MHLAINGSDLGRRRGGNESFILGLLRGFKLAGLNVSLSVLTSSPGVQVLQDNGFTGEIINSGPYRRLPYHLWQQTELLQQLRPDWYLSTYFLPPRLPCPGAVIVHDVSFRAHPGYFPWQIVLYMRVLTGLAIRQARVVLFDSFYTAQQVNRYYPAVRGKGIVTYPGVDPAYLLPWQDEDIAAVLGQYHLKRGYLLAIGNIHPRKNLGCLLEAYKLVRSALPGNPEMVWIGLPRWQSSALLEQAEEAGVILPGYIEPAHLPALYRAAAVFVYPSLYEGFGLPVLEAMASGTPVICSNTTSLPEAAGDAALLFDPAQPRELASALKEVLLEKRVSQGLIERGCRHAAKFTYTNTAIKLYQALTGAAS